MARLSYDSLSLDISFCYFEEGSIHHDVAWLWNNKPIINPCVLTDDNDLRENRVPGAFRIIEWEPDCLLIPFIRSVLESNTGASFTVDDPDTTIYIAPYPALPMLDSGNRSFYSGRSDPVTKREQKRKRIMGDLPEDIFEIVMFVDGHNFAGGGASYLDAGICLRIPAIRRDLHHFATELEVEWLEFKRKFSVDEYVDLDAVGIVDSMEHGSE